MLDCISVENMRESDAFTIATKTPSSTLMYRAALGIYRAFSWNGKTAILVGGGNNGGDGFALALLLAEHKHDCTVFTLTESRTPDAAFYEAKAIRAGAKIMPYEPGGNQLSCYDNIADCLLGTGFKGEMRPPFSDAVNEINSSGAKVVSADINSGMNGNTGEGSIIVKSDLTVTIGFVKHGLVTENAGKYIGRLVVADIGIITGKKEKMLVAKNEIAPEKTDGTEYVPMPDFLEPEKLICF